MVAITEKKLTKTITKAYPKNSILNKYFGQVRNNQKQLVVSDTKPHPIYFI